jgi:UPF0755 protein
VTIRDGRGAREPSASPNPTPVRRANPYQRSGRYGRGPGDDRRFRRYRDRDGGPWSVARFVLFLVVLAIVVLVTMATVARPLARALIVPWAEGNPAALRIGLIADFVREDIGAALTDPASDDPTHVQFSVESGDTPATLAPRLLDAGIIASERAFLFQAQQDGLTPRLTAGDFDLALNLTPAQVVEGLVRNRVVIATEDVTFREGLRLEQITAKLQTLTGSRVDPAEFYRLVTTPPDELLADFPWLLDESVRPKGATLEGFLYPATYTLRTDAIDPTTADDLVRMMLRTFHDRVGDERLRVPESRRLTFYQVLTLASIVDREAVLDAERPVIAGVYQNRIDRVKSVKHGLLQADPTNIYAVDTTRLGGYDTSWQQYVFWTVPEGGVRDVELPEALAGYNTYKVRGLPPAPIATPTIESIDAALQPDTKSGYTYFVAIPDGKGAHDFSKSLAEHEEKLRKYGY